MENKAIIKGDNETGFRIHYKNQLFFCSILPNYKEIKQVDGSILKTFILNNVEIPLIDSLDVSECISSILKTEQDIEDYKIVTMMPGFTYHITNCPNCRHVCIAGKEFSGIEYDFYCGYGKSDKFRKLIEQFNIPENAIHVDRRSICNLFERCDK